MQNWEVNTLNVNTYLRHVAINPLGIGQDVIPQNQASSQGLKKVRKPKHKQEKNPTQTSMVFFNVLTASINTGKPATHEQLLHCFSAFISEKTK